MMLDFTDKIVLITGASQGIGLGIAKGFLQCGATVHITGTRASADTYEDDLSDFHYHQSDLSTSGGRVQLHAQLPELDVLINNAAIALENGAEYEVEAFRQVMEMNVTGVMELCMLYRDSLMGRGGSIVNVGSLASHLAIKEAPAYTSSKSGLLGLTRVLADKWSTQGVRVNMIAPGFVRTRMTEDYRADPTYEKRLLQAIPMKRWAEPDEMAGAVMFLASPLASYITGVSLPVDGGVLLR